MNDEPIPARTWRQFLVVAELLHFGRAAERLHMTQPPLTVAIQQLERRLGVLLFARTRRSVALTPAGAALLGPVRQWLSDGAALATLARASAEGEVGRLRLGFVSTLGFGPLPAWLRGFREACPGVVVELREATSDVQREALRSGELDCGFMLHASGFGGAGSEGGLEALAVLEEPLVLALPDTHALAGKGARLSATALAALMREPLVIFPRGIAPSLHDAVLAWYHGRGVTPVIAQEAIQMQTIVNLVSAGLGLAWVPQAVTTLQRPGVTYRELAPALAAGAPRCTTELAWRSDAPAAVRRFADFVRATRTNSLRRTRSRP